MVLRTRFVIIGIVIESSHIFGPNAYANAFLRIRSYAPVKFHGRSFNCFKKLSVTVCIDPENNYITIM